MQPRRYFDAGKLATLMDSITRHGIMNPMIVEKRAGDTYLLVDGERRYRAAKELGLKDVPVIPVEAQTDTNRLIQQFHLQEQHEGWTAMEKARAVARLAKEMGISIAECGRVLGMPARTVGMYVGFANLLEAKEFEKQEMPIQLAQRIVALRSFARNQFEKAGEEFTDDDEHDLELAIITRTKRGEIKKMTDVNKVHDAIKADRKEFRKFLTNDKITVQGLFIEADAAVAQYYRNTNYSARAIAYYIEQGLKLKMENYLEEDKDAQRQLAETRDAIDTLLAKV